MELFIKISAVLFWLQLAICAIIIIFARRGATPPDEAIYEKAEKDAESRSKATPLPELTLSRLLDAYREAADMEFNETELTIHDLNQIDEDY